MPPQVRSALAEAKADLAALYGERLDRVVPYGSHARGDAHAESDVDLLVVLRGAYERIVELKRLSALRLDLTLRHSVNVSLQPYTAAEVGSPFMWNVADEGVTV